MLASSLTRLLRSMYCQPSILLVLSLAASALLLSGCGGAGDPAAGGGDNGGGGKSPSGCDWKVGKFEKIPKEVFAAEFPDISEDGTIATCSSNEDACGAKASLTPLKPGAHPHEKDQAQCTGKYSYTLQVERCGAEAHSGTLNQDSHVGWHTKNGAYKFSGVGVNLWTTTMESSSCAEVGWGCGCSGTLKGESVPRQVTGNLTLEVTMDTAEWPWYEVRFLPPEGATAPKGTQLHAPVQPKVWKDTIDEKVVDQFHPTFLLGPGAIFKLTAATIASERDVDVVV